MAPGPKTPSNTGRWVVSESSRTASLRARALGATRSARDCGGYEGRGLPCRLVRRGSVMRERILVAHDGRELRDILVGFLGGEGYEGDGCGGGEAALAALRGTAYDRVST